MSSMSTNQIVTINELKLSLESKIETCQKNTKHRLHLACGYQVPHEASTNLIVSSIRKSNL